MNTKCIHCKVKFEEDNAAYGTASKPAGRDKIEYCDLDETRTNTSCKDCPDFEPKE